MVDGNQEFYDKWKKSYKMAQMLTLGQMVFFVMVFGSSPIPVLGILVLFLWRYFRILILLYFMLAIPMCLMDVVIFFKGIAYCVVVRKTQPNWKMCGICVCGILLNCLYPYLIFMLIAMQ